MKQPRTARQFTAIQIDRLRTITPIRTEDGTMEYKAEFFGQLLGYYTTSAAAETALMGEDAATVETMREAA